MRSLEYFLSFFIIAIIGVLSTPEKEDCEWVTEDTPDHVGRMRDVTDCRYFYHCIPGLKPYRQKCPEDREAGYELFFNPNTTHCDYYYHLPPECFGPGGGGGGWSGGGQRPVVEAPGTEGDGGTGDAGPAPAPEPEPEPEPEPPTPPPRPPTLDKVSFDIDCSKHGCGIFPNAYGPCDTFVVCANGQKQTKKCNGGQQFDTKTKECQPAALATCWKENSAPPHIWREGVECPFHGYKETRPIEEKPEDNSTILQNPIVTTWGEWQRWEECPKGMYATGLYAWRRVLFASRRTRSDHIGIISVSFKCQSPGGNETSTTIQSLPPNAPPERWPFYYMCTGAVVGVQLNSAKRGRVDEVATDNVKGYCSCSAPVFKPYDELIYAPQSGHRGDWTETQFCRKHQAICGMQTQMHPYRERAFGTYDNTGLNSMKVKCCDVQDPLLTCTPKEERVHIRDCDNTNGNDPMKCSFDSRVGLTLDYDGHQKVLNWYSSVGYDFPSGRDKMEEQIVKKLEEEIKKGKTMEYTWDDVIPSVVEDQSIEKKDMLIEPFQKVELYQIVAKCNYYMVRSNRYVKIVKGASGQVISEDYFEV